MKTHPYFCFDSLCLLRVRGKESAARERVHQRLERVPPHHNVHNVGKLSLKWRYGTFRRVKSSPAVANGVVYVGSDDGKVYAFGLKKGRN